MTSSSRTGRQHDLDADRANESEERYQQLVGSLPVAVAIHVKGRVVFMNPEALRTVRAPSLEAVVGRSILDFVHPAYRAIVTSRVADAYEHGVGSSVASERFIRLDGEEFDVEVLVRPVSFDGQPAGQVVFWDVSERRRAEQTLRESEERYRQLVESMPDGVIVVCDRRAVYANASALRILGFDDLDELARRSMAEVIHPEDRPRAIERGRRVVEAGEPAPAAVERFQRRDGTTIVTEAISLPIRHQGRPAMQLVFRDITERLRLEDEVRQAEKMKALGQLASGVAHDFNNQLAGILGYAELLRARTKDDERLRGYAEAIATSAQHSARLTHQLLAFARKGKYQVVPVDLHAVIEETLALLERSIDKRIVIRRCLCSEPVRVTGDPAQLQNALLNVAINARDAMPDGGELSVETDVVGWDQPSEISGAGLAPGRYARVRIRDTGVGMDEETLRRAFEPFFTTKGPGRGTGLGLSAAYGIARNHLGGLRLTSAVGRGTTAEMLLPVATSETDARDHSAGSVSTPALRVLLADDEEPVRLAMAEMLETLGHAPTVCRDGGEAVLVFTSNPDAFDLAIVDMVMPVMSGADALARMRAVRPGLRAILSSGFSLQAEAQRVLGQGDLGLLQKPFTMDELSAAIGRVAGRGGGGAAPSGGGAGRPS